MKDGGFNARIGRLRGEWTCVLECNGTPRTSVVLKAAHQTFVEKIRQIGGRGKLARAYDLR